MTNKTYPELVAEGIKRTVFSEAKKMSSKQREDFKFIEKSFKSFMSNGIQGERMDARKTDDYYSLIVDHIYENLQGFKEEIIKLIKKLKFDDTNMGEMIMEFVEDEL